MGNNGEKDRNVLDEYGVIIIKEINTHAADAAPTDDKNGSLGSGSFAHIRARRLIRAKTVSARRVIRVRRQCLQEG